MGSITPTDSSNFSLPTGTERLKATQKIGEALGPYIFALGIASINANLDPDL
jgi:hypothetical protein